MRRRAETVKTPKRLRARTHQSETLESAHCGGGQVVQAAGGRQRHVERARQQHSGGQRGAAAHPLRQQPARQLRQPVAPVERAQQHARRVLGPRTLLLPCNPVFPLLSSLMLLTKNTLLSNFAKYNHIIAQNINCIESVTLETLFSASHSDDCHTYLTLEQRRGSFRYLCAVGVSHSDDGKVKVKANHLGYEKHQESHHPKNKPRRH
ncbi:Protein of unknown function [Gryllus bimaculatus]|nr:Protein of unknown function [Gryllus bimaculatus]